MIEWILLSKCLELSIDWVSRVGEREDREHTPQHCMAQPAAHVLCCKRGWGGGGSHRGINFQFSLAFTISQVTECDFRFQKEQVPNKLYNYILYTLYSTISQIEWRNFKIWFIPTINDVSKHSKGGNSRHGKTWCGAETWIRGPGIDIHWLEVEIRCN